MALGIHYRKIGNYPPLHQRTDTCVHRRREGKIKRRKAAWKKRGTFFTELGVLGTGKREAGDEIPVGSER